MLNAYSFSNTFLLTHLEEMFTTLALQCSVMPSMVKRTECMLENEVMKAGLPCNYYRISRIRGRSQTTFTRGGGYVVKKINFL